MPNDNRISAIVTQADKDAITADLAAIAAKLPFLMGLSDDDRKFLPKMRDKSLAFDEKCTDYMTSLPDLVPGFVKVAEVAKDRALREELAAIARQINGLNEMVEDTLTQVCSEIWMADLSFYQSVRQAAKRGVPGAQAAYDDMATRFPGGGRPPAPPAPAP